jgi:hypothetical protein
MKILETDHNLCSIKPTESVDQNSVKKKMVSRIVTLILNIKSCHRKISIITYTGKLKNKNSGQSCGCEELHVSFTQARYVV